MRKFSFNDTFPKLCLIVSSIGTFNYDLARCNIPPLAVSDDYSSKDTFSFVFQIKSAKFSGKFLVSYNITSLCINIPLQETIDVGINLIFNHNPNLKITKNDFFVFISSQTHFLFNEKLYNQIDGVSIGCPLSPVLANISMSFCQSKWLNELNLKEAKAYLKFFDDIAAAFEKD